MILIQKESDNVVIVTLTEKTTIDNPFYLFEFTNDDTRAQVFWTGPDLSLFPLRFNEFLIPERAAPVDQTEITLDPQGFWVYVIREQTTENNFDPLEPGVGAIVEIGKVLVQGAVTVIPEYTGQSINKKVYAKGKISG